jgi:hypothetical protein
MTSTNRALTRVLTTVGVTAAAVLAPLAVTGTASAAPMHTSTAKSSAPSACRPANYKGSIKLGPSSMGARHYRVTLKAAPGYENCTLQGFPAHVRFSQGKSEAGVSTSHETGQRTAPVTFGPGHPVHFDIKTPNTPGGAPVDGASFLLPAHGGIIPGAGLAQGRMQIGRGTQVGAIQPGA